MRRIGTVVREERRASLLALGALSTVVGAWTGIVVGAFRLCLTGAGRLRNTFLAVAQHWSLTGLAATVGVCAGVATLAAWLARRFSPYAEGSGIPEVEIALERKLPPMPLPRLLLVKFVGGVLALGGGLALGPEGPSVQMGAVGARLVGSRFRRGWPDTHALVAAGTGAGLAVAFNAPIAGAVFVLEELHRKFDARGAITALGASSTAILVARHFLGTAPLFAVAPVDPSASVAGSLGPASPAAWLAYLALGVVGGLAGALYCRALTGALTVAGRMDRWPIRPQAAVVGAMVGFIGWFAPHWIGGGESLTQDVLAGAVVIAAVPMAFALRFALGVACYGVRAPGGLFAPLLLLGAQAGFLWGVVLRWSFPALAIQPQMFAVIGMVAFFAGVIRAPITGIILVIEMTAAFTSLLPMLAASFAALVAADLTRVPPIYDSLRERLAEHVRAHRKYDNAASSP